jgi:hypothetical protein
MAWLVELEVGLPSLGEWSQSREHSEALACRGWLPTNADSLEVAASCHCCSCRGRFHALVALLVFASLCGTHRYEGCVEGEYATASLNLSIEWGMRKRHCEPRISIFQLGLRGAGR